MGLFSKIKSLLSGSPDQLQASIRCTTYAQPQVTGGYRVLFERVEGEQTTVASLPLPSQREVSYRGNVMGASMCLKQLGDRGELVRDEEGAYILPYEQIALLDENLLNQLNISQARGWILNLDSQGVVGKRSHIAARWTDPDGAYDVGQGERYIELSCGFLDTSAGKLHVFPRELLRVKRAADALRTRPESEEAEYERLAHLQAMIKGYEARIEEDGLEPAVQVELSGQLKKESFHAPSRVRVDVEKLAGEQGLRLKPRVDGIEDADLLAQADPARRTFFEKDASDGSTRRLVLPDDTLKEINRVRAVSHIPVDRVAEFYRDPRGVIHPPEEREEDVFSGGELEDEELILDLSDLTDKLDDLSLDEYSDRVAEISNEAAVSAGMDQDRVFGIGAEWFEGEGDEDELPQEGSAEPEDDREDKTGHASLKTFDNLDELEYEKQQAKLLRANFEQLKVPESFLATLHSYQEEGYAWLRALHDHGEDSAGGLLADDMGLGKTVQLIALISHMHEHKRLGPSLFVVPKIVILNWQRELEKFCDARLIIEEHLGSGRTKRVARLERADIVLTTYDTLVRDQLLLGKVDFYMLMLDEAQYIKNYTTKRASAARAMKARLRMALTATPVENNLKELWAIMDFAQPSLLGTLRHFRQHFAKPLELAAARGDGSEDQKSLEVMRQMGDHYLRRTKAGVLGDVLPQKTVHTIEFEMTPTQARMYEAVRRHYKTRSSLLPAIRPMLNVCTHPYGISEALLSSLGEESDLNTVFEDSGLLVESSNKFTWLVTQLEEIREKEEKVILFSSLIRIQALLHALIYSHLDLDVAIINGDVSASRRQHIIDRFNNSAGFNVIILSTQAAGVGVNVTGANHVIHMTREWNPAKENQATDRAYRIGQTKPVHVYLPITTAPGGQNTLDERLDGLLKNKQQLATNVIRPSQDMNIKLSDLESCLQEVN